MFRKSLLLVALSASVLSLPVTPEDIEDLLINIVADPKTPPSSISFPSGPANPFPNGIPTLPNNCNGLNPSEDCIKALVASGGHLRFDANSKCTEQQKNALVTAVWDASRLAGYATKLNPTNYKHDLPAEYYMGPDWGSQSKRITGNMQRVYDFKGDDSSSKDTYITVTCADPKGWCQKKPEGKSIGGYAWTKSWWWYPGYYHYIALCDIFFALPTLSEKVDEIQEDFRRGDASRARNMAWLKTSGQYFLHEMMHTRLAYFPEPEIIDERVDPDGTTRAYGAKLVHMLASRQLRNGGGATRASTNADSYAMLASARYWYDVTDYFPAAPPRLQINGQDVSYEEPIIPIVNIDLNGTDPAHADWDSLFTQAFQGYNTLPPDTLPDFQEQPLPRPTTVPFQPPVVASSAAPKSTSQSDPTSCGAPFCG